MTAPAVKLASVGLGWWGGVLADGIDNVDGAEVVACYARTAETREAFAAQRGLRAVPDFDGLLGDGEIDGLLLATSHRSHGQLIEAAAAAGKHVFVEKPFTLTVDEGRRAVAGAQDAGVVLQVGHNKRRQPANRRLKDLITSGALGSIVMIETHQTSRNALDFEDRYWRADREESPLGSMTSLGVHMIDNMHYLLGPVDKVSTFTTTLLDRPDIDHVTTVMFEFESGQLGYLGTSFVVPPTVSVTVRGTDGTAWNEEDGTKFYRQQPTERTREQEAVEVIDTVADQLQEFVAAVNGGPPPETGGTEGLEVIAVMAAAVASSRSGRAESVAEFR